MTEAEFIEEYERQKPGLMALGEYVASRVRQGLISKLGSDSKADYFVRLPTKPRVKENSSIIDKAFFRGKSYPDPLNDITDKVGLRFVVLLSGQMSVINSIIEAESSWSFSKDRDHADARDRYPLVFDYQSDHYIVRPRADIDVGGIVVSPRMSCEVQVRTLLQHTYSELAHDTIYKTTIKPESEVYRLFARSMALIETTDEQLTAAAAKISVLTAAATAFIEKLARLYEELSYLQPEDGRLNRLLCERYLDSSVLAADGNFDSFIAGNAYLAEEIKQRAPNSLLWRQSSILLVLYLISLDQFGATDKWPLQPQLLDGFFAALGISRR